MSIAVQNVSKRFGLFVALDGVSLEVASGRLLALLGPSGSGKTTLLRVIAGLEPPDSGTIYYRDDDVTARSARERNIGFVFQHYALFRHMTVFENIAFGLRVRKWAKPRVQARVNELLHLIRLEELGDRFPKQLSGGQRQRVALARALAPEPSVLLLDEPFGALDAQVRLELRQALRRLHDELHVTSIFVTHDQDEALDVADQVVVMNHGTIVQTGSPRDVIEHPANSFMSRFLGDTARHGEHAAVFAPPHVLDIDRTATGMAMPARVAQIEPRGPVIRVQLVVEAVELNATVELPPERAAQLELAVGEQVFVVPRKGLTPWTAPH